MPTSSADRCKFATQVTRRDSLRLGALSLMSGLTLPNLLQVEANAAPVSPSGKAKNVILLYLHGGAPTQDIYDMKPAAPPEIRGEFKPIKTSAPGIEVCEHLPQTAKWMNRAALVRSVNHKAGCHNEIPSYTGFEDPRGPEMAGGSLPPSMGSVCEFLKDASDRRPAYVYLPGPLAFQGETGPGAGFLGRRYDPLMTTCTPSVEPGAVITDRANPALIRGIPRVSDSHLASGMSFDRLESRRSLLRQLKDPRAEGQPSSAGGAFNRFQQQAHDILISPQLQSCFDPTLIDQRVKERYGNTLFGNSAFLATKLVAAGVRFVNVTWTWYNTAIPGGLQDFGWDTHEHNFAILKYYLPHLDQVYGSLLEDLAATGLLDETLVVIMSDFGRTPGVNKTAGRDHWTHCYSVLFAGAGIRGGTLYGASDKNAAIPTDNPVRPADICATIYQCLGIDPDTVIYDRTNRPHKIAQGGEPIREILV